MLRLTLTHISACILLLISATQLYAKQEVVFKNVSASAQLHNEVNCLAIKFDAVLKYSYNQLLQQGDSCDQYLIEAYLKNEGLTGVAKGYGSYQDTEGKLKVGYPVLLANDVKYFGNITVYIPLAAINLSEGPQILTPVFKITDRWKHLITNSAPVEPFTVVFPQKLNLRVSVKEIQAAETDFKNEFWDYFFADTLVARPEVCWSVLLATKKINGSPYTKDSYSYKDPEGKDDIEFAICKNDIFYINVFDFDMLSFSDQIGSMRIDMNDMKQFSGSNFTTKFGKVQKMDFVVTIL